MPLLGNLTIDAVPYTNPLIMGAGALMGIVALVVLGAIFYFKQWTYLWKEWLTTIDHKRIGVMYIIVSFVMLLRGFSDALLMRSQQMLSVGTHYGYLPPHHFAEIFSAHGVIMIFFVAMPFMFGLLNLVVPLQIGARDVAFPYLNSFSLWMTISGAMLVLISLVIGDFAATGWLAYPPLSELHFSPDVGVDYYIWALQIAGIGSLLSGVNFFATILKMRCPGMSLMKMPVFTWTALCTSVLVILAFPILTVTLALLLFDRFFGTHFFTLDGGGNMMMYVNLIWAWGHPEVYILILPAFGAFSEVTATFCKKALFGYKTMVYATIAIGFLSFIVWLHHFFTMGAGADVNAFFGIMTMIIAIPTGVKIFNWLFTMYRGKVIYNTPMLYTIGFIITFSIGGMTGVLMSLPPVDFQMHNSVFLIAHFHNVIVGGVLFGYFAGLTYWWPKTFGFKLNEFWGKCAFWCWIIGFYVAFMPLYIAGLKGMTRRLYHYDVASGYHPYLIVAAVGALIISIAILCQIIQLLVSIKNRRHPDYVDNTGDPWDGRTLEWTISSPPPFYNFAITPEVDSIDPYYVQKQKWAKEGKPTTPPHYADIHMPRNTSTGFIMGIFSGVLGFAMIWSIYWLAILAFLVVIGTAVARTFNMNVDYYVKASEVARIESKHLKEASSL
jgi:cytochrome o ubiquinol oxidase subunit 1